MKNIKLVFLIALICFKPVCADETISNSKSSLMYFFSLDEETREKLSQSFGNSRNSKPDNYSDKKIIITQTPKPIDSKITIEPINNNYISADLELINNVDSLTRPRIMKSVNNSVSIQLSSKYINYMETNNAGSNLDSETGWTSGFSIKASMMKNLLLGNDYLQAEYGHINSETKYTGSYWGGSYGDLIQNNGAKISNYHFRYGKGFEIDESTLLTPYFEIGKNKWDRTLRGLGGYFESYSHNYYGAGLLLQEAIGSKFVLSLNGLSGLTFNPEIYVRGLEAQPFTMKLGSSVIYKFGIEGDYLLTDHLSAKLGLEYYGFKYGKSNPQPSGVYEPDSRSKYSTINFGFAYNY